MGVLNWAASGARLSFCAPTRTPLGPHLRMLSSALTSESAYPSFDPFCQPSLKRTY
jgi:hypothetical protein